MSINRRRVNTRKTPPDLILIVTEGEKTEPCYFKSFPLHTTKVARIVGTGRNTLSLVAQTDKELEIAKIDYLRDHGIRLRDKDVVVWCVFDKDSFPAEQFDNAVSSARAKGYQVAYSNEAFELWYLLHFHYYNTALTRDRYISLLHKALERRYQKNDPDMYRILKHRQADAIRNATKLLAGYMPPNPSSDNPSTTVFELVEYLNQFINN
ncbi:MAG: RloB family protein [Candidatus Cloacimonetes bacterium]|nr:RloB family protein [Candidatus Cloacimonadota bacterium]